MNPACTGKHPYRTAVRAWRTVRKPRIWRGRRCGFWHIGKSFKSARAALRYEE